MVAYARLPTNSFTAIARLLSCREHTIRDGPRGRFAGPRRSGGVDGRPPRARDCDTLAAPGEVRRPTGYLVTFDPEEVGGVTDLRRGFPAAIDGVPGQLDLAGGSVLLAFAEQLASIVAPMPVDTDDADPASLFVSVDLAEWLASGMPVNPGSPIAITDGKSDALPGYSFSISASTFEPFDGEIRIAGSVDGAAVSIAAPPRLLLLGVAALSLLVGGRRHARSAR